METLPHGKPYDCDSQFVNVLFTRQNCSLMKAVALQLSQDLFPGYVMDKN